MKDPRTSGGSTLWCGYQFPARVPALPLQTGHLGQPLGFGSSSWKGGPDVGALDGEFWTKTTLLGILPGGSSHSYFYPHTDFLKPTTSMKIKIESVCELQKWVRWTLSPRESPLGLATKPFPTSDSVVFGSRTDTNCPFPCPLARTHLPLFLPWPQAHSPIQIVPTQAMEEDFLPSPFCWKSG